MPFSFSILFVVKQQFSHLGRAGFSRLFGSVLLPSGMLLLAVSCNVSQRNLNINLDETPLFPDRQWAIVNMPYIKVSRNLASPQNSHPVGMVRFGNIVEVLRVDKNPEDNTIWAYIVRGSETGNKAEANDKDVTQQDRQAELKGWVPYGFVHTIGSLKEAQLASRQMLTPKSTESITDSQSRQEANDVSLKIPTPQAPE